MSRIQKIKISNFKAISEFEADFKGCTAIVTAGNNMGKTSLLRGIPDRVRFVRPDVMVKDGATQGKGEMTLTTGEKFLWEFNNKGVDKLTFVSSENIKQNVTKELGAKYFPPIFDIDKFLQSAPKEQAKQLQKIIGIDFTEIDTRYLKAYNERTSKNMDAEKFHVKLTEMLKMDEVLPVDLTDLQAKKEAEKKRLNGLYLQNKAANDKARNEWNIAKSNIDNEVRIFNEAEAQKVINYNACGDALRILAKHGYGGAEVANWLDSLTKDMHLQKEASTLYPPEPAYITEMPDSSELDKIDKQILEASETNAKALQYRQYIDYKTATEQAKVIAEEADALVKSIEAERQKMIESAKFPKGVSINSEGITIDGLPLDRNQISASKMYCTALRIASMNLGEIKTLYFDASFLDRNSLSEIEAWANENDLQLLIERPDFEGGEIKYELIENDPTNIAINTPKDLFAA